jgi:hypothetical protein
MRLKRKGGSPSMLYAAPTPGPTSFGNDEKESLCTQKRRPATWPGVAYKRVGRKLSLNLIPLDNAVLNMDDAMRVLRNVMLVGYQDNRISLRLQPVHQRHNLVSGL